MKKISLWAKHHKWPARIIIIVAVILLNCIAVLTGILFTSLNVSIPISILLLGGCFYAVGFVAYPARSLKGKKLSSSVFYARQKSSDLLLIGSTFLMMLWMANHPGKLFRYGQPLQASTIHTNSLPGDSSVRGYKTIPAFAASMKDENGKTLKWKERKKLLREQLRAIKKADEPSKGGKIALTILSCLVAGALIILVASLACSLSCGGSDVAAVIVGIGGTALVVWLLIVVLRQISGKKKKVKDPEPSVVN